MHGHDEESRRWFAVVAAMRDRPLAGAGRGTGYSVALDALLLLHRDEPDRALRLLTSVPVEEAAEWYTRLFSWWTAALAAEAAVLAGAPEAQGLLAEAERTCARSELLSLVVRRARALAAGDRAAAAAMAARFAELGTPYQQERTRTLTGQPTP
jgi:hypothetical protein